MLVVHGVKFRMRAHQAGLEFRLNLPSGTAAEIPDADVIVTDRLASVKYRLDPFTYYDRTGNRTVTVNIFERLIGANETFAFGQVEPRPFQSFVSFTGRAPDAFEVQLPDISVNGSRVHFPLIQFTKESGFGLYPINC